MNYRYFKIMNLLFRIGGNIPFTLVDSFNNLEIEHYNNENVDIFINVYDEKVFDITQYNFKYKSEDDINYAYFENDTNFLKISYDCNNQIRWIVNQEFDKSNVYNLYIYKNWEGNLVCFDPLLLIGLTNFLINNDAILLHSSLIKVNNESIVFSAPSGTGKSTQADLWSKYYHAEILNGDRSIIKKINNHYYAFGSVYAGSSYIYRSEGAKIRAIIILKQAKYNKVSVLSIKDKFLSLISETLLCKDNKEIYEKQVDFLLDVISKTSIYLLECLPDKNATEVLYKYLEENK